MDPVQNENKVVVTIPTGIFKNRFGVTASFTLGVLLFFLPFINVKCNNIELASATGLQISTGFKLEPAKGLKDLKGIFDNDAEKNRRRDFQKEDDETVGETSPNKGIKVFAPNYFLAISLSAGVLGILLSLLTSRKRWLFCLVAGWIGITGFIISVFAILEKTSKYSVDAGFIKLSVNFTFWFFLSVIAYITAIILSHRQWSEARALERDREISEFILASGYPTPDPLPAENSQVRENFS